MQKINYVGRLLDNTYKVEVHSHTTWEVVYYTDGDGYVDIGDEKVPFEANDIFVIPPYTYHTDYSDHGFRNYHYNLSDLEYSRSKYLKFKDSNNKDFLKITAQLYYEYHLKRNNWQNIVNSFCEVLNQYMISLSEDLAANEFVEKVLNDIIYNFSDPGYDINSVIDKTHLNKDYFRRMFLKYTGKTPLQYLTAKRISFAKQLLLTQKKTNIPINEIAWRVGFSDYYYFSRTFKKETGFSPKYWADNVGTAEWSEPIPFRHTDPR